jgi:hypothetical protein
MYFAALAFFFKSPLGLEVFVSLLINLGFKFNIMIN